LDTEAAKILMELQGGVLEKAEARQTPALQDKTALADHLVTTIGSQTIGGLHTAG
jgi:hypothetical protein